MTVHMFRAYIGPDTSKMTLQQAQDAWGTWVENHTEWTGDIVSHSLIETNTELDGTDITYWRGDCRFLLDDAKDNLFQKLEDKVVNKVDWYRIGYHVCDHDESDRTGCSWDDEREWTASGETIPNSIPDFL